MATPQTYQLQAGDTLSAVADAHHLTLAALLAANPQITNDNLVQVGEVLNLPAPAAAPAPAGLTYDGIHPAPGTTDIDRAALIYPPVTSTAADRSQLLYDQVIDQLAVENNPRYLPGGGCTYCNIFVWDVTRAMNCPIPHWLQADGDSANPGQAGAYEADINQVAVWMTRYGAPRYGWQLASEATAQAWANAGRPAVAIWSNADGHGHTAMIRAGEITDRGAASAQAGAVNFNYGHLADGFGALQPNFYVHA